MKRGGSALTRQEEQAITQKVLDGDISAFETLVIENQKNVYNLALRMTGNEDDALDISQDVFFKAYQSLDSFRGESRFSVWLYRMTYNMCLDLSRKKKRKPVSPLTIMGEDGELTDIEVADLRFSPENESEKRELYFSLRRAIDSLTPEHRQVFIMREDSDMSYERIAEVLQISEGTVKSRLSRARRQIAKYLSEDGTFSLSARQTFSKEVP